MRDSMATGELTGFTAREFEWVIEAFPIARNFLVADLDGSPVGLILSDQRLLLVDPSVRRQGIGMALVEAMEAALESTPDGPLILFPPHGSEDALTFLHALGFEYDHTLWGLRLDEGSSFPPPALPDDITLAPYRDDDVLAYIDLINTAFADHPVPLRVTIEQIEHVHASPRFDPAAIAILRDARGEMIGFCTTGIDREDDPVKGYINLLGLLPGQRGRGLGRWLLLWGIERLRSQGVARIELGVEANNDRAMTLYRSVGFDPVDEWPQWMRQRRS